MSDDKTNLTLTGVVHAIPPPRTYNDKTYPNLVLEIDPGKYPQYPKLECRDSLSGLVANLGVGSTAVLRRRPWIFARTSRNAASLSRCRGAGSGCEGTGRQASRRVT
jgi:hypothetical protein